MSTVFEQQFSKKNCWKNNYVSLTFTTQEPSCRTRKVLDLIPLVRFPVKHLFFSSFFLLPFSPPFFSSLFLRPPFFLSPLFFSSCMLVPPLQFSSIILVYYSCVYCTLCACVVSVRRQHTLLGPSSAHPWWNYPYWLHLCETYNQIFESVPL